MATLITAPFCLARLVSLLWLAGAVRDADEVSELAQEEVGFAGTGEMTSRANTSASLDVPSLSNAIHVCCLGLDLDRATYSVVVYHESASSAIGNCVLTLIASPECANRTACEEDCNGRFRRNVRFHNLIHDVMQKKDAIKRQNYADMLASQEETHAEKLADLVDRKRQTLAPHEQAVEEAEANSAKLAKEFAQVQEEHKTVIDKERELAAQVEQFPAKIEMAEVDAKSARTEFETAENNAESEYLKDKEEEDEKLRLGTEKIQDGMQEVDAEEKKYRDYVAALKEPIVPERCAKTRDCCCVVGGRPIRVHKQFEDWEACERAAPYSETAFFGLPCDYFKECGKCRDLICGKEIC